MPAPSSQQQSSNHAIRKSQSLGGFQLPNTPKNSNKNTSTTLQSSTVIEETTDNDATPVATPLLGRKPKAKLGNLFKWFRSTSESKDGQNAGGVSSTSSSKSVDQPDNNDIYAKVKKTQALKALERSIFSKCRNDKVSYEASLSDTVTLTSGLHSGAGGTRSPRSKASQPSPSKMSLPSWAST